jgi:hypothetical protein
MKTILLVAALGFGTALTPAFACDWQKEANYTPVVVPAEQAKGEPTTNQSEATAAVETSKTTDEAPTAAPATLAADIR